MAADDGAAAGQHVGGAQVLADVCQCAVRAGGTVAEDGGGQAGDDVQLGGFGQGSYQFVGYGLTYQRVAGLGASGGKGNDGNRWAQVERAAAAGLDDGGCACVAHAVGAHGADQVLR
jgi:hypothetical protein